VNADRFRTLVSGVLIVGVVTSATLITAGFVAAMLVGWDGSLLGRSPTDASATDFSGIVDGLIALRPIAIAQAGLLVLLATPVLRVAASVAAFTLEGDRLYAAITLVVLIVLLTSLFLLR
jgi:uncharacterized membrane protein